MENNNNIEEQELPMNWWKFWQYFAFPVGILLTLGGLAQYSEIDFGLLNTFGWIIVILHFGIAVFLGITYTLFLTKKPQSYNVFITYLFLYTAWNTFTTTINNNAINNESNITQNTITFLITYGIMCGIWVYPNYIYFKKRKKFFYEDKKNQISEENREDEQLEKLINKIEEKSNNEEEQNIKIKQDQKYCTKCGKVIDDTWAFCNYCGNKLK